VSRAGEPKMEIPVKRVLILSAGFGGLYTALGLEKTVTRDPGVRVTIVNRENHTLFTPMLHEVAASDLDMTHIVNPIRKLLRHVRFFSNRSAKTVLT
jgi:NADH:ubiquinone reductase (H+-translocating)